MNQKDNAYEASGLALVACFLFLLGHEI